MLISPPSLASSPPILANAIPNESTIFAALLISAKMIFLASKLFEEIFAGLKLPGVLGQLIGGLILGISAFNILVFAERGDHGVNSSVISLIQWSTAADLATASAAYAHQLTSQVGQIIISAAVLDDLLGILILAVVVSLVQVGTVQIGNLVWLLFSTLAFVSSILLFRQQLGKAFVSMANTLKTESALLVSAWHDPTWRSWLGVCWHRR